MDLREYRNKIEASISEEDIQETFIEIVEYVYPSISPYLFHIPNGGLRDHSYNSNGKKYCKTGSKLKRLGVKRGVADLFLMIPSNNKHGLWLEFKSKNGKQTEDQKRFQIYAESFDYQYSIIRSVDEAFNCIDKYLSNNIEIIDDIQKKEIKVFNFRCYT